MIDIPSIMVILFESTSRTYWIITTGISQAMMNVFELLPAAAAA